MIRYFVILLLLWLPYRIEAQQILKQTLGVTATFAPTSSHILIGYARDRRTTSAGFEYTRYLGTVRRVDFEYVAVVNPFFQESDPEIISSYALVNGGKVSFAVPSKRVISKDPIVGVVEIGNQEYIQYGVYSSENSYGFAFYPAGVHMAFGRQRFLRVTFDAQLGAVISGRDIPIDDSERFNFLFCLGPGVDIRLSPVSTLHLAYLYSHLSNRSLGDLNPGVDQGAIRLTLSRSF
jgi:hypothetical protein